MNSRADCGDSLNLEAALMALQPAESRVNRDATLFEAGRAVGLKSAGKPRPRSRSVWVWPGLSLISTSAATVFAVLFFTQQDAPAERVQIVYKTVPAAPNQRPDAAPQTVRPKLEDKPEQPVVVQHRRPIVGRADMATILARSRFPALTTDVDRLRDPPSRGGGDSPEPKTYHQLRKSMIGSNPPASDARSSGGGGLLSFPWISN